MQHTKLVLEVWGKTAAENAPIARPIKTNGTDENTCQNISHLKFARANGRICQKKHVTWKLQYFKSDYYNHNVIIYIYTVYIYILPP